MESNNGMLRGTGRSLKQTSICVVSGTGSVVREGVVDSAPDAIAAFVRSKIRVGLEDSTDEHMAVDRVSGGLACR